MALAARQVVGGVFSLLGLGSLGSVAYSAATKPYVTLPDPSSLPISSVDSVDQKETSLPDVLPADSPAPHLEDDSKSSGPSETDEQDDYKGPWTTYSFFLRGKETEKDSINCPVVLKPDFDYWGERVYIGCGQHGNERQIDSGSLLKGNGVISCTASGNTGTFECVSNRNNSYRLKKDGERKDMIFIEPA
ncbi:hypothetical protein MHLP_01180 [Candidatus Mycoplasma haematolamae str. Purdue]|uniref:Uncharacterized protein n=1 Tax=Mycoplasma haematolamae (strain Purdue) TaxID=1212765 RepID=I7CEX4_MYCHA|nr:hypothetical protein [Candidatus Mycoplasma haematolamae]AFO51816.1 hypothetical protein MHLP_01180 [Candidatus Mycoplasma haematolamae str. Purdue]